VLKGQLEKWEKKVAQARQDYQDRRDKLAGKEPKEKEASKEV